MAHALRRLLLLALLALPPAGGQAAVYRLYPDGGGDFPSIALALHHAQSGDIIELADGVYRGSGNRDLDFGGKAIALRSLGGDPERCVIDAEGAEGAPHRLFRFVGREGAGTLLRGVTLTGGYLPDAGEATDGGAIYCEDSTPRLENCIISGNRGWRGGGLYCRGALPLMRDCLVTGNAAGYFGGGIAVENLAGDLLEGCRVLDNTAPYGGGIALKLASPVLSGCLIARNAASVSGGGLYAGDHAFPSLSACTLADNQAPAGSALALVFNVEIQAEGVLIAFNSGGLAVSCDPSSQAALSCCDVYGNAGEDWGGCLAGQLGEDGNIEEDPLLCADGGYGLQADSPCAEAQSGCGRIGALPVSCGGRPRALAERSWGMLKSLYSGS